MNQSSFAMLTVHLAELISSAIVVASITLGIGITALSLKLILKLMEKR